jgi:carbon-monoxide dehydrogenase medium subunit
MGAEDKATMAKEYFKPKSIGEAISLLQKYGDKAQVLAGGTELFEEKGSLRAIIVDISEAGLTYINADKDSLKIGSCATFSNLIETLGEGPFNVIAQAAQLLGTPQVRNIATIGGNLCNASPAADSAPPLYVLQAQLKITGPQGSRSLPIEDFITGPHQSALTPGEILEEIQISQTPNGRTFISFHKAGRVKGHDLSVVNGSVAIVFDSDKRCKQASICLGAVAPTPIRANEAEKLIQGKQLSEELIERAAEKAADVTKPIDDVRASAAYRRLRSHVLVKRALLAAIQSVDM